MVDTSSEVIGVVFGVVIFAYLLALGVFLILYRKGAFQTQRADSRSVLERLNQ